MKRRRTRVPAAAAFLAALVVLSACATVPAPRQDAAHAGAAGYRALFRGTVQTRDGREHFRMAATALPPDRIRLEFLGPIGGPQLIVTASDAAVVALRPAARLYARSSASPETMDRLLGIPLDSRTLIALLLGMPPCAPDRAGSSVLTRTAATFARTIATFEVTCPPGDIRYRALAPERGAPLSEAMVRDGLSGEPLVAVQYAAHAGGAGRRYPGRLRLEIPGRGAVVTLEALEGPQPASLPSSLFDPAVPADFRPAEAGALLEAPGLLGGFPER